ncbi:MAG: RnfABCDGE type electron transport complex subunit D, partial [Rhodospirillales bacterium]|nr:RnfABCDGE type electron transport complex subunit D [Rhodospirillales bacterium]
MTGSLSHPRWRRWLVDARHYQIAALATLLVLNLTWLDFGADPRACAVLIAGCCLTQVIASRIVRIPVELRSALITSFSLSLLLRTDALWLYALAAVIAVASKFLIRIEGKHLFNPATIAIVALVFGTGRAWVTPGQWGAELWFAALLGFLGIMVLQRARRGDVTLYFLAAHGGLLVARALYLGDPLAVPLHQLESGSLLLFAFFMISDPKTIPDSRLGRLIFAFAVAALAHYFAFFEQVRPALYLALALLALTVWPIDRLLPAPRHQWVPATNPGGQP